MGILSVCDSRWKALLQHTTVCTARGLRSTMGHCDSRAVDWRAWGGVFGNKNGSGYQSSFSLLSLLVLCSFPWKLLQLREQRAVLRSSRQSSRGRGPSCHSSATSLCTSRPPVSCAQTQCHLPSVRSQPRSVVGMEPQHGTFGDKTAKTWSPSGRACTWWEQVGTRTSKSWGKPLLETPVSCVFSTPIVSVAATFPTKLHMTGRFLTSLTGDLAKVYSGARPWKQEGIVKWLDYLQWYLLPPVW